MKWLFLGVLMALSLSCHKEIEKRGELSMAQGHAMGTTWRLVVREGVAADFEVEIGELLQAQEARYSNWKKDSEVARVERGEVEPSSEMGALLELGAQVKAASEGAFNVAWQGGIDLGGIAKGWAVDRVGERLVELGQTDFVIELGGEILAKGNGPTGDGWQVGVEAPDPLRSEVARTITLRNEALATSGNYQQPTHLKDGRTGAVVDGPFRSVSVVMPTCAEADAWATALFALGKEPSGFSGEVYWNRPD